MQLGWTWRTCFFRPRSGYIRHQLPMVDAVLSQNTSPRDFVLSRNVPATWWPLKDGLWATKPRRPAFSLVSTSRRQAAATHRPNSPNVQLFVYLFLYLEDRCKSREEIWFVGQREEHSWTFVFLFSVLDLKIDAFVENYLFNKILSIQLLDEAWAMEWISYRKRKPCLIEDFEWQRTSHSNNQKKQTLN